MPSRNKNRANCIKTIPEYIKITASCINMIKIPTFKQQKLPSNQNISIMNNVYYCKDLYVCIRLYFREISSQRRPKAWQYIFIYRLRPTAGCSSPTKCKHFVGFWGCEHLNFMTTTINDSHCGLYLHAFSNERVITVSCIRFTSVRLSRQKFAITRISFAICKFFPHNDK